MTSESDKSDGKRKTMWHAIGESVGCLSDEQCSDAGDWKKCLHCRSVFKQAARRCAAIVRKQK